MLDIPLVGCDPEVFLKRGNTIISAIGVVGGSKENPLQVEDGTLQEDNILAEIGITPASDKESFVNRVSKVLGILMERTSCSIDYSSSHVFTKEWLRSQGGKALTFGCDRDYNAYTGMVNPKPSGKTLIRSAGGHIHLGRSDIDLIKLVKTMDLYLAVPSILADKDTDRRSLYGKAGCYREKPYGVEYRTLSNFWLRSKDKMGWAYEQSVRAVLEHKDIDLPEEGMVQACINTSSESLALELIGQFNLVECP